MADVYTLMAKNPDVRTAVRTAHIQVKRAQYGIAHPLSGAIQRTLIARSFAAQNAALNAIRETADA